VRVEESGRFLKKAAQKLLRLWAGDRETSTAQIDKVFLLLFVHKKKRSSLPGRAPCRSTSSSCISL
jgi:hypothetical protein